jgi:hypothetical protein
MDVPYVVLNQVLADLMQLGLVLDPDDDDRRVIGEIAEIKSASRFNDGVAGLNGLLGVGDVFADEDVNKLVRFLNLRVRLVLLDHCVHGRTPCKKDTGGGRSCPPPV